VKDYLDQLTDRQWGANTVKSFSYLQCSTCSLVFLYPTPSSDEVSEFYPPVSQYYAYQPQDTPRLYSLLSYIVAKRGIIAAILKWSFFPFLQVSEPGRVLDVGCGVGHFLNVMQEIGHETWGMEMNQKAAKVAGKRHRVVSGTTLSSVDLPQSYFDQITMFQVFEHLINPLETLMTAKALLKPEGRLFIATPNVKSQMAKRFGRDWRGLEYPRHIYLYSPEAVCQLLGRAGFHNLQCRTRFAPSDLIGSLHLHATSRGDPPPVLCSIPRKIAMLILSPSILYSNLNDSGTWSLLEVAAEKDG
jgi:SAM-dependent methyltransferase